MIAYCHMPTHYHWVLRQDGEQPVSNVPQRVWGSYTRAYNNAYGRSGTLFEARFKAILIDSDSYLRHVCRYVHANPVVAAIAAGPDLWPYSNYLEWIEARPGDAGQPRAFVKRLFPTADSYREYVHAYLTGQAKMPQGLLLLERTGEVVTFTYSQIPRMSMQQRGNTQRPCPPNPPPSSSVWNTATSSATTASPTATT